MSGILKYIPKRFSLKREEGNVIFLMLMLAAGCGIMVLIHDWIQDVKEERKAGPKQDEYSVTEYRYEKSRTYEVVYDK